MFLFVGLVVTTSNQHLGFAVCKFRPKSLYKLSLALVSVGSSPSTLIQQLIFINDNMLRWELIQLLSAKSNGPWPFHRKYQLEMDNVLDQEIASSPRLSSRLRMPNSLRNQVAILVEKLYSLRQSRGGYVATMSKLCLRIDELLQDNSQLAGVRSLQTAFNDAFSSFRDNVELTRGLLPEDSIEL